MEAVIYCGKCGKSVAIAEYGKGKQTKCVRCGVSVPVPSAKPNGPQIRLFCSQCGGRLSASAESAGTEMLCPSCRLAVVLPFLETPGDDKGDTQPLLPALNKGDTHPIDLSKAGPAQPLPDLIPASPPEIAKGETRPIEEDDLPVPKAVPKPPSPPPEKRTPPASPLSEPPRGDTQPVAVGPPPRTDTRPVPDGPAQPAPEIDDSEVVELEDRRARWMDSLLDEFVEKHHGEWKTGDLIELSERLSRIGYRYLDIVALNAQLQKKRDAYNVNTTRNMEKLLENGILMRFVDSLQGRWGDKELAELVKQIRAASLWPVKLPVLNKSLEELRQPWKVKMAANLKRLVKDGVLRAYIESRRGGWTQEGWKDLMQQLDDKGYAPTDPTAVAMALRKELTLRARENLARLQKDGVLSKFVAAHQGNWNREDLQKLLRRIEDEGYAPVVNLGAALDAERVQWEQQGKATS